jgi:hypothetical protein
MGLVLRTIESNAGQQGQDYLGHWDVCLGFGSRHRTNISRIDLDEGDDTD